MSKKYLIDTNKYFGEKNNKKYLNLLKKEWILEDKEFKNLTTLMKYNYKNVLDNFDERKSFLLYGDVQSGKTNNLIYIIVNLFDAQKIDLVIYLTGIENDLLTQNQERFFNKFEEINENDFIVIQNKKLNPIEIEHDLKKGKKIIISSLKTNHRLKQIRELINKLSQKINILILDDEADQASLSEKSLNIAKDYITKKNIKYLSITASPFANLYYNHDFYDYFFSLQTSTEYMGIDDFWSNIIIKNKKEKSILFGLIKWADNTIKSKKENSQLLINIFSKQIKHNQIYEYINSCIKLLSKDKNMMKIKHYLNEFQIQNNEEKIQSFFSLVNYKNIVISNGTLHKKEIKNKGYEIIIGGIKLSRGITFHNLLTEIMLNMNDCGRIKAGTIIQRARWFGYRKKNIDNITIIMTPTIYNAYKEIKNLITMTKGYNLSNNNYKSLVKSSHYKHLEV